MTVSYKTGQITLTNGSPVVTGVGTAWLTSLIAGGIIFPEADGNPLPIDSVDNDVAITAATKWKGASGTYNYALVRDTGYLQQVSTNSNKLAELISELAAGTIFKYDASGDLAGRATYDGRPKNFSYLVSIGVPQPQLYVKASATSGDWSGPFNYGKGDMGPATTLNFGATVTESPATPASVDVAGDGPYSLTFHIPRGADGDISYQGSWTSGNNYTAKQVVTDAGSAYICKANHTAAAANEPGIGASWATYWDLFISKGGKGDKGDPGDMDHTVYDPQNKHADAFLRSNHTGDIPDTVMIADAAAPTKKGRIEAGNVTAGQTRVLTLADFDIDLAKLKETLLVDVTLLAAAAAISSGPLDTTTYSTFYFELVQCYPVNAGAQLNIQFSQDGGGTFPSSGYSYSYINAQATASGPSSDINGSASAMLASGTINNVVSASATVRGLLSLQANPANVQGQTSFRDTGSLGRLLLFSGQYASAIVNAFRFLMGTGNINAGARLRVWGVRR